MGAKFEEPDNENGNDAFEEPWRLLQNNSWLNNELEKMVPLKKSLHAHPEKKLSNLQDLLDFLQCIRNSAQVRGSRMQQNIPSSTWVLQHHAQGPNLTGCRLRLDNLLK